jgi:hypothetical protein
MSAQTRAGHHSALALLKAGDRDEALAVLRQHVEAEPVLLPALKLLEAGFDLYAGWLLEDLAAKAHQGAPEAPLEVWTPTDPGEPADTSETQENPVSGPIGRAA